MPDSGPAATSSNRPRKIEATKPSFVSRITRTSHRFSWCIVSVSLASMGWLPMLLGEIPGHCNLGTLIVRGQWRQWVRAHDGAKAGVVPREIAAGLSDAGILYGAVAHDAEGDGAVKAG